MTYSGDHSAFRAMLSRMLRAYARRVASSSVEDLAEMVGLRDELNAHIHTAAQGLHADGVSYADLAAALGVTRQAAHKRFAGTRNPRNG